MRKLTAIAVALCFLSVAGKSANAETKKDSSYSGSQIAAVKKKKDKDWDEAVGDLKTGKIKTGKSKTKTDNLKK